MVLTRYHKIKSNSYGKLLVEFLIPLLDDQLLPLLKVFVYYRKSMPDTKKV